MNNKFISNKAVARTHTHILMGGGTKVMLVYASGQCMEQQSLGCSQLWHSAPPRMVAGFWGATAKISTSEPAGLQLVPRRCLQ